MSHIEITFGELLEKLDEQNWRHWVYVSEPQDVSVETVCFVIDTDNTDLEEDDFTPSVAARKGLKEFLSVHDLKDVREYLANVSLARSLDAELFAIQHYFKCDAYPSEEALAAYI